jgi:hypothetical protein
MIPFESTTRTSGVVLAANFRATVPSLSRRTGNVMPFFLAYSSIFLAASASPPVMSAEFGSIARKTTPFFPSSSAISERRFE